VRGDKIVSDDEVSETSEIASIGVKWFLGIWVEDAADHEVVNLFNSPG